MILLLAAAIWGFAFVAQRLGMNYVGPFTYTAVRFSLGVVVLLPFLLFRRNKPLIPGDITSPYRKKLILFQLFLGLILFGGISFQQYGLQYTTAGNAGFITGLYVVFVPLVGIFQGEKLRKSIWLGVGLAIAGLYLLSIRENFTINFGDSLILACAFFWTIHVLLVAYLAPRTDPIRIALIQFAVCAFLSWAVALIFEEISLQPILDAAWPIIYGGVMSVGIAYTLQIVAQQRAHPAYASLILSLETVFAVLGGWLILNEALTGKIIAGCLLMLSGMIVVQLRGKNSLL